ncbi:MAG: T9SS type A sorting domain-containing protein [Bacteroidetes bacterium]|nr:T9SS type A sorting domain-containing protein [Bacteroidota bacterium]
MVNKLCIPKNILVVISCALSCSLTSQIPYNPTPANFSGNYSSGTQNNYSYNATLNTVNASSAVAYDIKASNSIGILAGSSAANFSSGSFAAHIDPPPFEVVSYHPGGFNNIPLYDKFELGIKLPDGITKNINDFFGNTNYVDAGAISYPCPNGYGNQFNTGANYINPYDPDQISVEATFSFPGQPSQTIYGFYYREYTYQYNSGNTMSYTNVNWLENTNLQYHWRVRFAPKYIGNYTVTWKIKTNNGTTIAYQDNIGQTFSTVTSNSLGFVKLGVKGKFLVTQPDENQPQKTIVPIGTCNTFPSDGIPFSDASGNGKDDDVPYSDGPGGCIYAHNYTYPSRYYKHRKTIRERLANQGANYTRVYNIYCGYDFEWEKAGVYDADPIKPLASGIPDNANPPAVFYKGTNRQAILWEFDSLVDMAKNKNLYLQWVFEDVSNGFLNTNYPGYPTWSATHPYRNLVSPPLDPNSCTQFFTDVNAKKMYKKKLRYLIARYGYATSITAFEMFNEFHHLQSQMNIDNVFKPWLQEMLDYIKNPNYLNHKDHLCTASYQIGFGGDQVGTLTDLDFFATHPYPDNYVDNSFERAYLDTKTFKTMYNGKPCQAGEMGIRSGWAGASGLGFPELMGPTFHSLLWSTTFIGGLTSGLEMWDVGLKIDPNNTTPYNATSNPTGPAPQAHSCGGDGYVQHFKPLQAFIKDGNFDQGNYVPKYYKTGDQGIETFYLVDNLGIGANFAIGYVRNRTFWWTSFANSSSGAPYYDATLKTQFDNLYPAGPPIDISTIGSVTSGNLGTIQIQGLNPLTYYEVFWYDTYSDPPQYISTTGFWGGSNITPPPFYGCHNQEYAFKIYPYGLGHPERMANNGSVNSLSPITENEIQFADVDIKIYPNPSNAVFNIKYPEDIKVLSVSIIDNMGSVIKTINNKPTFIDLGNFSNGLYQLQFQTETTIISKKITLSN